MKPLIINVLIFCFLSGPAFGGSWGDGLFTVNKHDFGTVALGSEAVYAFGIENVYVQDIRILGVYSSCGCTIPSRTKEILKSGEKGAVLAKLNTNGQYLGQRGATLTVDVETTVNTQLLRETVQLTVSGYIRSDVVLTPGSVQFGSVPQGQTALGNVELHYTGRNDWTLTKIDRHNPFIYARADEVKRSYGDVVYQITVKLKEDAPVGYIKDILRFATNEVKPGTNEPAEIELPVQGVVAASLRIVPPLFMTGVLAQGDSVAKNIVIRNSSPFKISAVDSPDKRFKFTFSKQESPIQILSVLFTAKDVTTETLLSDFIRIQTNIPERESLSIKTETLVMP
ncbi:MAG: DUF1573 domain-containing protein [Planctomycetaceae bacterium]|jgi:hypothetical protein|nr:DUF1573 domain-containing protein [Planctomycetaceae bacterium]